MNTGPGIEYLLFAINFKMFIAYNSEANDDYCLILLRRAFFFPVFSFLYCTIQVPAIE